MPQKLDQSSNSTHKTLTLFSLLLFGRKEYSLKELAEHLQCSRQTVLRLIDQIEVSHILQIDKTTKNGQNYYKSLMPQVRANVSLTPLELKQVLFCRDLFLHLLPKHQKDLLVSATNKASLFTQSVENMDKIGHSWIKGSIDYTPFENILDVLTSAIHTHQVVEIEYLAKEKKEYKIHALVPIHIVVYHDNLYIRAWKVTEKGQVEIINPITFALHRMHKIWSTCRFMDIEMFNSNNFVEELEEKKIFGMAMQSAPFQAKARFYPPSTAFIRERIWSSDQTIEELEDKSLILTFTAQSEMEVVKWVLGYGIEAELLSPLNLREKVKLELKQSLLKYK